MHEARRSNTTKGEDLNVVFFSNKPNLKVPLPFNRRVLDSHFGWLRWQSVPINKNCIFLSRLWIGEMTPGRVSSLSLLSRSTPSFFVLAQVRIKMDWERKETPSHSTPPYTFLIHLTFVVEPMTRDDLLKNRSFSLPHRHVLTTVTNPTKT